MRLVLCDDQRLLCEALAAALEEHDHEVVAVTTTASTGVTAVAAHDPDICLLDLCFPDAENGDAENGLDAARAIVEHHPSTKVLVLSGVADPQELSEAMGIGVAGVIPKDQSVEEIADALDVIAAGGTVFDMGLYRGARHWPPGRQAPHSAGRLARPVDSLTPREREILARIVEGQSTKQMARAMRITTGTAGMYARNVLTKLGVHSRLQAAALVSREGLLDQLRSGEASPS
jgi:two-component system, NarL family, nitrate/nitrite response regulator NarL